MCHAGRSSVYNKTRLFSFQVLGICVVSLYKVCLMALYAAFEHNYMYLLEIIGFWSRLFCVDHVCGTLIECFHGYMLLCLQVAMVSGYYNFLLSCNKFALCWLTKQSFI